MNGVRACAIGLAVVASNGVSLGQATLVPPPATVEQAAQPDAGPAPVKTNDRSPRPLGAIGTANRGRPEPSTTSKGAAPTSSGSVVQTIASLGVVLGLILALGAGMKKVMRARGGLAGAMLGGSQSPAGILEVLGRYPVSRGSSLLLLKVDRRILLISQPTQGFRVRGGGAVPTTLCEISDPDDVASIMIKVNEAEGRSIGSSFRQALAGFERQHDGVIEERPAGLLGRLIRRGSGGDRTELLNDRVITAMDDPLRLRDFEHPASDTVGSIRSKLSALRAGGAA